MAAINLYGTFLNVLDWMQWRMTGCSGANLIKRMSSCRLSHINNFIFVPNNKEL